MRHVVAVLSLPWVLGACSGGCDQLEPLPAPVPTDQTVEGGVQVRVTPAGFDKLTAVVPGMVNDAIADGFCVGEMGPVDVGIADIYACDTGACAGGAVGCPVSVTLESLIMSVPDPQTFRVDTTFDVFVPIHVTADWIIGGDSTCTFNVTLDNGHVVADIGFGIDQATGELTIELTGIDTFDISNLSISGCGVLGSILDAVVGFLADVISSEIGTFIIDALTPVINGFLQDMLPDPLGIEGLLDMGGLLAGLAPGVNAKLETRAVAGGYVSLPAQGLSVGMIVGLNADQDPTTRDPMFDNEGAYCVPNRAAPDFSMPPASLPMTPRGTFALQPAGEFLGMPDPAHDLALGVSETVLDLGGHHIVQSGAMCLGVGSDLIPQLNLGIIGILVPSLSELGETQKEPLLLVLRPQQPLDFTVGEGTDTSPRLTIHIKDLDVDFYAFLFERYLRAFTITLNLSIGLNLDFTLDDMGQPAIMPTILGLDADAIDVEVSNEEFLNESAAQLEAVFPTVFDLVLPLIADGLGAISLPDVAGFSLENLQITRVQTSEDDFLAIYATLAPGAGKMTAIEKSKPWNAAARAMRPATPYVPVETEARLVRVTTPAPERVRAYYLGEPGGARTEIELSLGGTLPGGERAALEWQWRLNGGLWHPYADDPNPVLRDDAFAIQGRHVIEVRARQKGDYRTFDPTPVALPIEIDSVPPWFLAAKFAVDGDDVVFPATDLVSTDDELEYAFAPAGQPEAATPFERNGGRLSVDALQRLAARGHGEIEVHARDTTGNRASTVVHVDSLLVGFHGRAPSGGGCECHAAAAPHSHRGGTGAAIVGVLVVCAVAFRRQLRRFARIAGVLTIAALTPGCNCSPSEVGTLECDVDEDCAEACPDGEVPICIQNECACLPDLQIGSIGMYSDLGVSPVGGAYVSAYNKTYGDLMVARVVQPGRIPVEDYEFVDGIPDQEPDFPQSDVRGGIRGAGDDVGLYTSIAVNPAGEPMVSYYDRTNGSLRFAHRTSEFWKIIVVDAGDLPSDPELGGEDVGRYSTISIGPDGRPAIAYFALVYESGGVGRSELRFAQANTPSPSGVSDWSLYIVDEAPLPPAPSPGEEPPVDLPEGVGLFVASTRLTNGAPILAYYDRLNGDLKLAYFNPANGIFDDPIVADGADGSDVGQYPSISAGTDDVVRVSYVDATRDNLIFLDLATGTPEVVDDGYRIDGNTQDGLPLPVYHFVGDDSALVIGGGLTGVVYQDATSHELLYATRNPDGTWLRSSVAGSDEEPWKGGYGFYAAAELDGEEVVMSSYVVDQQAYDAWVEVFRLPAVIQ